MLEKRKRPGVALGEPRPPSCLYGVFFYNFLILPFILFSVIVPGLWKRATLARKGRAAPPKKPPRGPSRPKRTVFEEAPVGAPEKSSGVGIVQAEYGLELGQGEVRRVAVLDDHDLQRIALIRRVGRVNRGDVASEPRSRVREVLHVPAADERLGTNFDFYQGAIGRSKDQGRAGGRNVYYGV